MARSGDSSGDIHPAITVALDRIAGECERRHERSAGVALKALDMADAARTRLIVVAGEDGKGGDMQAHGKRLDKIEDTIERQRAFLLKLALAVVGASFGGAGLVQFLISALGSG